MRKWCCCSGCSSLCGCEAPHAPQCLLHAQTDTHTRMHTRTHTHTHTHTHIVFFARRLRGPLASSSVVRSKATVRMYLALVNEDDITKDQVPAHTTVPTHTNSPRRCSNTISIVSIFLLFALVVSFVPFLYHATRARVQTHAAPSIHPARLTSWHSSPVTAASVQRILPKRAGVEAGARFQRRLRSCSSR
jgi:hypothetical protein